jgi:hypothetical protein
MVDLKRNLSLIDTSKSPYLDKKRSNASNQPFHGQLDSKRSPLIGVDQFDSFMPDFNMKRAKANTMQAPGALKRRL